MMGCEDNRTCPVLDDFEYSKSKIQNLKSKIEMPHRQRKNIRPGLRVAIVLKQDQRTGRETIGTVKDLLTNSANHPHGIKVRLTDGQVGRVQKILPEE
jgi:uncharacterized repeat protein (TIGR03833 family)